jgi:hypothetical protein
LALSTSEEVERMADDLIVAPVLKDVDIKYSVKSFNGSFMQQTVYRLPGSDEVDKAWEALGVDCELANFSVLCAWMGD